MTDADFQEGVVSLKDKMKAKNTVKIDRLKKLIDTKTREEIAAGIGCDTSLVTKHYNEDRTVTLEHLARYCAFFHVSADYLLGISDAKTADTTVQAICDYTGLSAGAVFVLDFLKQNDMEQEIRAANAIIESEKINEGADVYNLLDLIAVYLTADFEENNRTMLISKSGKIEDPAKISPEDWNGWWDDVITYDSINTSTIIEQAHFSNITNALREIKHTVFKKAGAEDGNDN